MNMHKYQKFESLSLTKKYKNEPSAEERLRHHVSPTFKFSKMMFDGKGDPQDQLAHMNILGASVQVKCGAFWVTPKDSTQAWCLQLLQHLFRISSNW